jgi:hypothetical protein
MPRMNPEYVDPSAMDRFAALSAEEPNEPEPKEEEEEEEDSSNEDEDGPQDDEGYSE